MSAQRYGHVDLRVTMCFPSVPNRPAVTFSKRFEVLDHPEDFILGAEMLDLVAPNTQLSQYTAKMASITDRPHDIIVHDVNVPAVVRSVSVPPPETSDANPSRLSAEAFVCDSELSSLADQLLAEAYERLLGSTYRLQAQTSSRSISAPLQQQSNSSKSSPDATVNTDVATSRN